MTSGKSVGHAKKVAAQESVRAKPQGPSIGRGQGDTAVVRVAMELQARAGNAAVTDMLAGAPLQRRTALESYATAGIETGPVWDVTLRILGAPENSTEDFEDFDQACMDGIRDATEALGNHPGTRKRDIQVTIQYRRGQAPGDTSTQAFDLALASVQGPSPNPTGKPVTTAPSGAGALPKVTKPAKAPHAALPSGRTASQLFRLELIRSTREALAAEFATLDAALPPTKTYEAYSAVRGNVMADISFALADAETWLKAADVNKRGNEIQAKLEQAQLWLFFVARYAHVAAIIRSAEVDRLGPKVIVLFAAEADGYQRAFGAIATGKPALLAYARDHAVEESVHTQQMIAVLQDELKRGQHRVEQAEKVEAALDVPIEFAAGIEIPAWALFADLVADRGGFYLAHRQQLNEAVKAGGPFVAELAWLEENAPNTRADILNPIFVAIGKETVKSVTAADVAFVIGRTIRNTVLSKSALGWGLVIKSLAKSALIVGMLDLPKFTVHGMGRLVEKTKATVLASLGGEGDVYGLVQELNEKLGVKLTPDQAADLVLELITDPVRQHIGYLSESAKTLGPNIIAISADVEGTGMATSGSAQVAQGISESFPLLPPAP